MGKFDNLTKSNPIDTDIIDNFLHRMYQLKNTGNTATVCDDCIRFIEECIVSNRYDIIDEFLQKLCVRSVSSHPHSMYNCELLYKSIMYMLFPFCTVLDNYSGFVAICEDIVETRNGNERAELMDRVLAEYNDWTQ